MLPLIRSAPWTQTCLATSSRDPVNLMKYIQATFERCIWVILRAPILGLYIGPPLFCPAHIEIFPYTGPPPSDVPHSLRSVGDNRSGGNRDLVLTRRASDDHLMLGASPKISGVL